MFAVQREGTHGGKITFNRDMLLPVNFLSLPVEKTEYAAKTHPRQSASTTTKTLSSNRCVRDDIQEEDDLVFKLSVWSMEMQIMTTSEC